MTHLIEVLSVEWNPHKARYEIIFGYDEAGYTSATYLTLSMLNDTKHFPFYLKGCLDRLIKLSKEGYETPSNT